MISPAQYRAARGLLDWSQQDLAREAEVGGVTIRQQLSKSHLGRRFFRERPGQHELGLEYGAGGLDHAVERCCHPALHRMKHLPLHRGDDLAGVTLVSVTV
jgi:hypothetical protein